MQVDATPPVLVTDDLSGGTAAPNPPWYSAGPVTLNCAATDATSGMDPVNPITYAGGVQTVTGDGTYNLSCAAHDYAGNTAAGASHPVQIDGTAPTAALLCNGASCGGGWYTTGVTLSVGATDATSGIASTGVSLDGGATWAASATLGDGVYAVQGRSFDRAGNVSPTASGTVGVDTIAPVSAWGVADGSWVRGDVVLSGTSTDAGSGVAQVYVSTDGGGTWVPVGTGPSWSYTWPTGTLPDSDSAHGNPVYTLLARADDLAGNAEHTATVHLRVDNTAPDLALPNPLMGYDPSQTHFLSADAASGLSNARITFSGNGITPRVFAFPTLTGNESITWDGRDGSGLPVPAGTYNVLVEVWDLVGNRSTTSGQWVRVPVPTETLTPTRMPTDTPAPKPTATNMLVPVRATATAKPTSVPTATRTPKPAVVLVINLPLPQLPLGIPIGMLFLPVAGVVFWLFASGFAFSRDRRGIELKALGRSVNEYLSQNKINSKGGEEND